MYDDNPGWQLYFGMLTAMYHNNTVRIDTAGTAETIATLTPEMLFDAYHAFYNLHNMALVVCGDVTPEEVEKVCDKILKEDSVPVVERFYPDEPKSVKTERISRQMEVAMPMFSVGVKDSVVPCTGEALTKKEAEYDILLEMMFGKSSPFYTKMYEAGLIDSSFGVEYETAKTFAHCVLSGSSNEPEKVYAAIREEIARYQREGLDETVFNRVKKADYASTLRDFNSTEDIANDILAYLFTDFDFLDLPAVIDQVTFADVTARLQTAFDDDAFVLSTIMPRKTK